MWKKLFLFFWLPALITGSEVFGFQALEVALKDHMRRNTSLCGESCPAGFPTATNALDLLTAVRRSVQTNNTIPSWQQRSQWQVVNDNPKILVIPNFVTDEEIDHIIAIGTPRLNRSHVVGHKQYSEARTSNSAYLERAEDEIIARIEARAAALVLVPVLHVEPLQFLRYEPGQFFKPHFDYFTKDGKTEDIYNEHMSRGGQRKFTILVYLNDMANGTGGQTTFPKLGISVTPVKGSAVVWPDMDGEGNVDPRTLHEGAPPTEGIKMAMNIWIRERPFDASGSSPPKKRIAYGRTTGPKGGSGLATLATELEIMAQQTDALARVAQDLSKTLRRVNDRIRYMERV